MKSKKLYKLLEGFRDKKFLIVDPSGNWGDHLIRLGAYKLLDTLQIDYVKVSAKAYLSMDQEMFDVIYIQGGGGFNQIWHSGVITAFEHAVASFQGIVILGPQTFTEDIVNYSNRLKDLILNKKTAKIFIFTREMKSFELFKSICPNIISLEHDHDTALNLTKSDLPVGYSGKGVFFGIRSDEESSGLKKINPFLIWIDPVDRENSFEDWVLLHSRFNKIVTNRLHSAILSTILGRKVILLPNSYHKTRLVWEYSLKDIGVEWKETIKFNFVFRVLSRIKGYARLCNSSKLTELLLKINFRGNVKRG